MTVPEHGESEHGHYIQANDLDIYYEEHGQGKTLLLIHGGALQGSFRAPKRFCAAISQTVTCRACSS